MSNGYARKPEAPALSAGDRYLLRQLKRGPAKASDFGDANARAILSLINRGLVERFASDPGARTKRLIRLTSVGVDALDQLKD